MLVKLLILINFYPRPPYGGRPCRDDYSPGDVIISIHVPRMGDDPDDDALGATDAISIHVPRMGDDSLSIRHPGRQTDFYPRPPYGGRPNAQGILCRSMQFLSTSPVWGTTTRVLVFQRRPVISIHVPRMGDDALTNPLATSSKIFLSTSPVWGTT